MLVNVNIQWSVVEKKNEILCGSDCSWCCDVVRLFWIIWAEETETGGCGLGDIVCVYIRVCVCL